MLSLSKSSPGMHIPKAKQVHVTSLLILEFMQYKLLETSTDPFTVYFNDIDGCAKSSD